MKNSQCLFHFTVASLQKTGLKKFPKHLSAGGHAPFVQYSVSGGRLTIRFGVLDCICCLRWLIDWLTDLWCSMVRFWLIDWSIDWVVFFFHYRACFFFRVCLGPISTRKIWRATSPRPDSTCDSVNFSRRIGRWRWSKWRPRRKASKHW